MAKTQKGLTFCFGDYHEVLPLYFLTQESLVLVLVQTKNFFGFKVSGVLLQKSIRVKKSRLVDFEEESRLVDFCKTRV